MDVRAALWNRLRLLAPRAHRYAFPSLPKGEFLVDHRKLYELLGLVAERLDQMEDNILRLQGHKLDERGMRDSLVRLLNKGEDNDD